MNKVCEYQGWYIDCDEEEGEQDVLKCKLFTNEGIWDEYCYCDEEEKNNCMLFKYSKIIEEKDEKIKKLKSIKKDIKKYVDSTDFIYDKQYIRQDKIKDILDKDNKE